MGYVYLYYNDKNECKYIGQSIDWKRRFYQHSKTDMKDKIEQIKYIIVFRCGKNNMDNIENYLINLYLPEWNNYIPTLIKKVDMSYYKPFCVPIQGLRR